MKRQAGRQLIRTAATILIALAACCALILLFG